MNRKTLIAYGCLALAGCLGSAATDVGSSDGYPLFLIDGKPLPVVLNDANGTSAQVTGGRLTVYTTSYDAVYHIEMSNGKSIDGTKDILNEVTGVPDGVRIIADLSSAGGPTGPHNYDFSTIQKQCMCGKFCNRNCLADRVSDSLRDVLTPTTDFYRAGRYRTGIADR